jgi:outer membrane protein
MITMRRFAILLCAGSLVAGVGAADPEAETESLTIDTARSLALSRHPRVQMAELFERIAYESVAGARSSYFPTADAYADSVQAGNANTRILAGGLNNPSIFDRTATGVSVSQLITDFGRTSNLVASARLSAKAETANSAATRAEIILNVDTAYYRALEAMAVLNVANATVSTQETLTRLVEALARNHLKSDLDLSFAQVGLEQSRLVLQGAEGDARSTQASLSAALGYRQTHSFSLAEPTLVPGVAATAAAAADEALQDRPDLLRLRFERDAANSDAKAEKDRGNPVISAVGTMGVAVDHDNRLPNKYAAGGIMLDFPLFAGGDYIARERAAELRAQVADEALREAEDNVSRDVSVAWVNYQTARLRLRTTDLLVKHADEAYTLAQARYKAGSSSIVELNDAQLNATSARIADATARYEILVQASLLTYETGHMK